MKTRHTKQTNLSAACTSSQTQLRFFSFFFFVFLYFFWFQHACFLGYLPFFSVPYASIPSHTLLQKYATFLSFYFCVCVWDEWGTSWIPPAPHLTFLIPQWSAALSLSLFVFSAYMTCFYSSSNRRESGGAVDFRIGRDVGESGEKRNLTAPSP